MNIDTVQNTNTKIQTQSGGAQTKSDIVFSDELKSLSENQTVEKQQSNNDKPSTTEFEKVEEAPTIKETPQEDSLKTISKNKIQNSAPEQAIDGLEDIFDKISKLNRTDDNLPNQVKDNEFLADINKKDRTQEIFQSKQIKNETKYEIKKEEEECNLIDNNMNIQEPKEQLQAQISTNLNFNSNGQPFSEFVNPKSDKQTLAASEKDIKEEKAILSTMEENIAIANKNIAMKDAQKTKTVTNEEGIKKVDKKTNVTVETIVSYDSVIMDKADVEFFAKLVNGDVVNTVDIKNAEKSVSVSKTLADLIAKSIENNKPIRIDFDNNISVIIKISRDGKISADFLPSSQVAEAYLKENLPLLRQKFDDNNIEYEELNQRKQNQDKDNQNRKKGSKDE